MFCYVAVNVRKPQLLKLQLLDSIQLVEHLKI